MTAPNSKMTTTSVTVISPSLADLEAEFAATLKNDLPNVIRRGELLLQIKQALKRGKWLPWLANKFALSESTAQNYMKAARFAAKYPIVRDLKIEPVVVYRLAADRCRFTPDQFEAVFAAAKDRWISWKDVLQAADGAQTVHAGPIDPDAEEPAEAIESTADIPDEIEGRLDRFDAAMRLMLEVATMPAASFVTATYQPATPAHDIEKVGDFLKTLAGAMTEQALDMAA